MATREGTLSLTRPKDPAKEYTTTSPHFVIGPAVAVLGVMALMVFFIISAIVAGWVSDQDPTKFGRITAYQSWLFPVATAAVATVKIGIAIVLYGIVRRLWVRVESLKESVPLLVQRSTAS